MKTILLYIGLFSLVVAHAQQDVALVDFQLSHKKEEKKNDVKSYDLNKNAVHGMAGAGVFAGFAAGYYERTIWYRNKWSVYARGGIGAYKGGFDGVSTGAYGIVQVGTLFGRKSSRLEMAGGFLIGAYIDGEENSLSGNLNYRYQKPNGPFLFRAGTGWPEILFLGLGVAF